MKNETKEKFLEFCKKEHFDISSETSKQREAVFSDEKYVIPAGAGSGKTTVLTYRFLRLLIDEDIAPIHSDEILTMTFTKAATANMKSRIYKALKVAESNGLIDKEEIDRFSNAEICTTDSFCSKIVRLDSIRYGITPDFNIEDDDEYEEWVENTVREIILEKIKDKENVMISYGKGTIIHPHFAILPAILIAVPRPPKIYETSPAKIPIPNNAPPNPTLFAERMPPIIDNTVAPSAIYCAIFNLFMINSPLLYAVLCISALADELIIHKLFRSLFM